MKRKRRLLLQIGIVVFVVLLLIMLLTEYYIYTQNTKLFLKAKNEMIDRDLDYVEDQIRNIVIVPVFDYWIENPEVSSQDTTYEEFDWLVNSGYYAVMYPPAGVEPQKTPVEFYESIDDEDYKLAIVKEQRDNFGAELAMDLYAKGYADAYCIKPINDKQAMVISYNDITDRKDTVDLGEDPQRILNEKYYFTEIIDFDIHEVDGLDKISYGSENDTAFKKQINSSDNKAYYTGYHPVFNENNELLCIIVIEYDWSDVYTSIVKTATYDLIRNTVIVMLFSASLILICLFFVAVRPLRKVRDTMDLYGTTKKSEDVENNLADFKSKNEIGELANHFIELTKEMERYTEENIALAADKARIKTELDVAADIQGQALIKEFPESEHFEVSASMTPAKEVGGDLYDVFKIDEDHLGIVIADVSGKGVPAALLMMAGMNVIRSCSVPGAKPSEILAKVNEMLVQRDVMNMFITIWLGILDTKTGLFTTSNAGHEFPAINSTGKYELFHDKHGMPAGSIRNMEYQDHEIQLKKSDSVFVYTDGVPEATDKDDKFFGTDRMLEALNKEPDAEPVKVLENVKRAVDEYVGNAEQFDDLTMLCIKYKG